jgi:long-subunit acyl-CoA synthetase (AMP-forming)
VVLDLKDRGQLDERKAVEVQTAMPDDVALILHTSGTTGKPKAVPLCHKNLVTTMSEFCVPRHYRYTHHSRKHHEYLSALSKR